MASKKKSTTLVGPEAWCDERWRALRVALGSVFTDVSTPTGRQASELAHQATWYSLQLLNPKLSAVNRKRLQGRCARAIRELMGYEEGEIKRLIYDQIEHFAWHVERTLIKKKLGRPFEEPDAKSRARNVIGAVADVDPILAARLDLNEVADALKAFSWQDGRGKPPTLTREKAFNAVVASAGLAVTTLKQSRRRKGGSGQRAALR